MSAQHPHAVAHATFALDELHCPDCAGAGVVGPPRGPPRRRAARILLRTARISA